VLSVRPSPQIAEQEPAGNGKAGARVKVEPYEKMNIDLELVGTYHDLLNFIKGLTEFPKIVLMNNMQILPIASSDAGAMHSPKLDAKFGITAFILKAHSTKFEGKTMHFGVVEKIKEHKNEYQ
jgi:hypothetical protein